MPAQSYLLILLPVVAPLAASSVAAIIAQSHWPAWANDMLAWLLILLFAIADVWANNAWAGASWLQVVGDVIDAITFLASGWLVKLDPWLAWLGWLQANVFDIVPLLENAAKPANVTSLGTRAYVPTGDALLAPKVEGVPPRASAQEPPR